MKLRVKEFLRALYVRMVADHGADGQRETASSSTAAFPSAKDPAGLPPGRPDDGLRGVPAHALVVSHGAYMRVAVRYLVEDLQASLAPDAKASQLFSACPNTGVCRFVISLRLAHAGPPTPAAVRCVFVNRKEHLKVT